MIIVLEMDEKDAILKAKNNDSDALNYIFNKYKPLVNHIANKYYLGSGGDKDDIIQTANIALWDAVRAYDGKSDFSRLAKTMVNRAIMYILKKNVTQKSDVNNTASSLDDTANDGDTSLYDLVASDDLTPEELSISQVNINALRNFMDKNLSDVENNVIALTIKGYKEKDITDILNIPRKSVNNALARARAKIKKFVQTELESKHYIDSVLKVIFEGRDSGIVVTENEDLMKLFHDKMTNKLDLYSGVNHNMIIGTGKLWKPIVQSFETKYNCKVYVRKYNDPDKPSESYWYIKDVVPNLK